jgi:ERCC4-related helicase
LISLGWQQRDADGATEIVATAVVEEGLDVTDIPMLLRRALSSLDRV